MCEVTETTVCACVCEESSKILAQIDWFSLGFGLSDIRV